MELGAKVKLGPGLSRNLGDDTVLVTETGILQQENGMAWMASAKKRYIPVKGDLVLGVVTHKHPEYYRPGSRKALSTDVHLSVFLFSDPSG